MSLKHWLGSYTLEKLTIDQALLVRQESKEAKVWVDALFNV